MNNSKEEAIDLKAFLLQLLWVKARLIIIFFIGGGLGILYTKFNPWTNNYMFIATIKYNSELSRGHVCQEIDLEKNLRAVFDRKGSPHEFIARKGKFSDIALPAFGSVEQQMTQNESGRSVTVTISTKSSDLAYSFRNDYPEYILESFSRSLIKPCRNLIDSQVKETKQSILIVLEKETFAREQALRVFDELKQIPKRSDVGGHFCLMLSPSTVGYQMQSVLYCGAEIDDLKSHYNITSSLKSYERYVLDENLQKLEMAAAELDLLSKSLVGDIEISPVHRLIGAEFLNYLIAFITFGVLSFSLAALWVFAYRLP